MTSARERAWRKGSRATRGTPVGQAGREDEKEPAKEAQEWPGRQEGNQERVRSWKARTSLG